MKRRFLLLLIAVTALFNATKSAAAGSDDRVTYSLMLQSLAPNAGGQQAYALRRGTDKIEMSLFANRSLYAGNFPLMGATYDWRFAICGRSCFWQFYAQAGVGLSTAGPMVEILWSSILLWTVRIDMATHLIVIPNRVITWSYPLWVGFAIPL